MTSNTDTDDLSIYMGLKYRSMRHVTLGVTIMVITLCIDTIDGNVTDVFATYSEEATWAIVTCSLINATNVC